MVHALATAICVCVCACVRAGGYVHTCIHLSERVKHFTVNGLLNITATLYNRSRSKMCWVHYNITHTALALCLTCFMSFCSNTPHQYTSLHTLHPLIFSLMPFGWLLSVTPAPTYSIISYGNIIFDLSPLFLEPSYDIQQGTCVTVKYIALYCWQFVSNINCITFICVESKYVGC